MNLKVAVKAINKHGMLLVFPVNNKPQPLSLWSVAYPKSDMIWEWDDSGDNRVSDLWHLREKLSISNQVIYTKWYQGRATCVSLEVFKAMMTMFQATQPQRGLSRDARNVLEVLEMDSPLSTRALKKATELGGRLNERAYDRAMKELWQRLLIVAYGEVAEGAFPSLAIGATRLLFEDMWKASSELSTRAAEQTVRKTLGEESLFFRFFQKQLAAHTVEGTSMGNPR